MPLAAVQALLLSDTSYRQHCAQHPTSRIVAPTSHVASSREDSVTGFEFVIDLGHTALLVVGCCHFRDHGGDPSMNHLEFSLITAATAVISLLYSIWWPFMVLDNSPDVPKHRRNLQIVLVFFLLASCWFVTYAITQADLHKVRTSNERADLTLSSYGAICVCFFAFLLFWDCLARGRAPHLVPTRSGAVSLMATTICLVPGMTLLAVYKQETVDGISEIHTEYIESLKPKGIIMVSIGYFFDLVAVSVWLRGRVVRENNHHEGIPENES